MTYGEGTLGIFAYGDDFLSAIKKVRERGHVIRSTFSPSKMEEAQELLESKPSAIPLITLIGGILGGISLVSLGAYAHNSFRLITGGKPVFPVIPWIIVCFEGTILFAVLFSVASWILKGGLPRIHRPVGYDVRFSEDKFGILVSSTAVNREEVATLLREAGAEEVRVING